MFCLFSQNKTQYQKGQVFPFLIGILAIVIILIMITVNLGQIGIFKTQVSNAADAAALAGASVLSQTLLEISMLSEMIFGALLAELATIIVLAILSVIPFVNIATIPILIGTIIAFYGKVISTWWQAYGASRMGIANAKKTALTYAYQNVGVDQPKPNFNYFLEKLKSSPYVNLTGDLTEVYRWYQEEIIPEANWNPNVNSSTRYQVINYARPGFSRFMEDEFGVDGKVGYWQNNQSRLGIPQPHNIPPLRITSGFGWGANSTIGDDNCNCPANWPPNISCPWKNSYDGKEHWSYYDNYVEVQAQTVYNSFPSLAPLTTWSDPDLFNAVKGFFEAVYTNLFMQLPAYWFFELLQQVLGIPNIYDWLAEFYATIITLTFGTIPFGLTISNQEINDNYITVRVTRYKKDNPLGLWRFRYGNITAEAQAHAFNASVWVDRNHNGQRENNEWFEPTVRPVAMDNFIATLRNINQIINLENIISNIISGNYNDVINLLNSPLQNISASSPWATQRHLYETTLVEIIR